MKGKENNVIGKWHDYKIKLLKNGIKIGCQKFTFAMVKKAGEAIKVRKSIRLNNHFVVVRGRIYDYCNVCFEGATTSAIKYNVNHAAYNIRGLFPTLRKAGIDC